jgi:hypothetical protein
MPPSFATLAAFPNRPLAVRPPRTSARGMFGLMLGLLVCLALGGGAAWFFGPGLLQDRAIADAGAVPARDARLVSGRCSAKLFLHWCDGTLAAPAKDGGGQTAFHYLFVDFHTGSRTLDVLRHPAQPAQLTTDLGLDQWTNRAITLAAFVGLMALAVGGLLLRMLRGDRLSQRAARLDGRTLQPVPVQIAGTRMVSGIPFWKLQWFENGRRTSELPVPKGAAPFLLRPDGWVLAVRDAPGRDPLPLDADLGWVGLTEEERSRLHQARTADWQAA